MNDWKPQDLHKLSNAYWGSCALHAAVKLDVFTPLAESPLLPSELANLLQCDKRGMELLLTALCGLGLLRRVRKSDPVEATDFTKRYLCAGSPDYLGYIIKHQGDLVESWARLGEAVREGQPQRGRHVERSPEERESFLLGMANIANIQASHVVPHLELEGRRHLLDLGGGPGAYAVHFCRRYPQLVATIFDLPSSEQVASKLLANQDPPLPITFSGGDFLVDPLPKGCDVIWISQILHAFSPEECQTLLDSAFETAEPGALIFIQEFMVTEERDGPAFAGLFGLNMLVGTAGGQTYSAQAVTSMLTRAGAQDVALLPLDLPQDCSVIRGVKPN